MRCCTWQCSISGLRRVSSNETAVAPKLCTLPLLRRSSYSIRLKKHNMAYIVQCAREAVKIISQYDAEKHQRKSISVLIDLLCTLDSREFWYIPSTPRGSVRPIFPRDGPFFRDCMTFVYFALLIGLKTL